MLNDDALRQRLAKGAADVGGTYTWGHAQRAFGHVVESAIAGVVISAQDET